MVFGSGQGELGLVDTARAGTHNSIVSHQFDRFHELTSVSVNSNDHFVAVSGYRKGISL